MPSGELDFPARPLLRFRQFGEYFGLQDIAANHRQGRWRFLGFGFFDQALDLRNPAIVAFDIQNAIAPRVFARHVDHGDDIAAKAVIGVGHLLQTGRIG